MKILHLRGRGHKNPSYLLLKAQQMAGQKDGIHRCSESSLKCGFLRVLVQRRLPLRGYSYGALRSCREGEHLFGWIDAASISISEQFICSRR
jgi:hypothetical protein